jgi:hypothetical protein
MVVFLCSMAAACGGFPSLLFSSNLLLALVLLVAQKWRESCVVRDCGTRSGLQPATYYHKTSYAILAQLLD